MIKDDLVHMHRLLDITTHNLAEMGIEVEKDNYSDVSVGPYAMYENMSEHEEAVIKLTQDINERLEEVEESEAELQLH